MSDVVDYKIFGDDLQLVEIELDAPGEGDEPLVADGAGAVHRHTSISSRSARRARRIRVRTVFSGVSVRSAICS